MSLSAVNQYIFGTKHLFIFLLFAALAAPKIYSQSDSLTQRLNEIKTARGVLGMSVAVTKGDEIVYSKGFGIRDVGRNLTVNDSTVYRIASISKMLTATALMRLYDQGWINLDADISNYLGFTLRNPNFPNDMITLRMVLSHTASLRDGTGYDGFLSASYNQNPPPHIKTLLQSGGQYYSSNMWSTTLRPAQKYFSYSNINFGVIGTVVENVSSIRFDIFCRENIFQPLGIDGSFNVRDIVNINNVAPLYRRSGSVWVAQTDDYRGIYPAPRDLSNYTLGTNGLIFAPQGGVRVSANGLAKFMLMHLNGGEYNGIRILSDSSSSLIQNPGWIYNGSNGFNYYGIFNTYGFGCSRTSELLPGETLYGHPGEAYGLISDMYFSRSGDYGIIFITNGGQWGSGTYSGWYNVEEEIYKACLNELPDLLTSAEENFNDVISVQGTLSVYPNPIVNAKTNTATLLITGEIGERENVVLYNSLGQQLEIIDLQPSRTSQTKIKLKTEGLSGGVYFIEWRRDTGSKTIKWLII